MRIRRMKTFEPLPKALALGAIEDNGRYLFHLVTDKYGVTRVDLPYSIVKSGESITAKIKMHILEIIENNIEIGEPVFEIKYNYGSKRNKNWIPAMVFKIETFGRIQIKKEKMREYKWLKLEEAVKFSKTKESQWFNYWINSPNKTNEAQKHEKRF